MLSSYNEAKRKVKPKTEDTVINIQHGDIELREDFILENRPFILDCVTNYKKDSRIDYGSDEFSIAMIAFNEAINTYNVVKGKSFYGFAQLVIRNRLTDYARKIHKDKNVVSLEEYGSGYKEEKTFDIPVSDPALKRIEIKDEINSFIHDLKGFQIKLKDLVKLSPKQIPARERLINLARTVHTNTDLLDKLKVTKKLPIKEIMELTPLSRGTIELNRKYIIALVLIMDSNLDTIKEYIGDSERSEYDAN